MSSFVWQPTDIQDASHKLSSFRCCRDLRQPAPPHRHPSSSGSFPHLLAGSLLQGLTTSTFCDWVRRGVRLGHRRVKSGPLCNFPTCSGAAEAVPRWSGSISTLEISRPSQTRARGDIASRNQVHGAVTGSAAFVVTGRWDKWRNDWGWTRYWFVVRPGC